MEEEMGAPAPQAAPQGGGKEAETMLKGISMALGKAAEILPKLGASEEDAQAMAGLVEQYQTIVAKVLGGEQEEAPAPQGQAPMEAGAGGVPMGQG